MLSKKPMSFSEMLEVLGVSSSFLTYHLENLGELVGKMNDGTYRLSSFGEAAITTMIKVEDIPATAPKISSVANPKRFIRRSVPIALGIICIILVAGIGGTIAYYMSVLSNKDKIISSQSSQVSSLTSQNNQLQAWLNGNITYYKSQTDSLNVQIADKNSMISSLETLELNLTSQLNRAYTNISQLNDMMTNLQNVVNLDQSEVMGGRFEQQMPYIESWGNWIPTSNPSAGLIFKYAGYLSIEVSATADTTVELTYEFQGFYYSYKVDIGTNGTAIFPVLPSPKVMLTFNSTKPYESTVTDWTTYYY
jgi:CRISPR/Cas system CMR-associated protein Cmr5 small subunit